MQRRVRNLLQEMMVKLVKSVSEKMKGFSRSETLDYYKTIMEKAWQQIEAADTPEVKSQKFDEALEWTMLDKDYDDRTRRVFTARSLCRCGGDATTRHLARRRPTSKDRSPAQSALRAAPPCPARTSPPQW